MARKALGKQKEKYVKFQSIGNVYRDFTFNSTAPITAAMLKNAYKVTGKYHHFNGKIYDSIKDINGNWIGYVEESKLTIQGDQRFSDCRQSLCNNNWGKSFNMAKFFLEISFKY